MANEQIRKEITKAGVTHWQLADRIGISSCSLSVWLRHELTGERLRRVQIALNELNGGVNCA